MSTHYRFVVQGRVQGVGFRQATMTQAQRLGLHGWVTNRADGSVEGEVSHERYDLLADFHQWLQRGPVMASVEAVEWIESPAAAPLTAGFSIRR